MEKLRLIWKYSFGWIFDLCIMFFKGLFAVSMGLASAYITMIKLNADKRKTRLRTMFAKCLYVVVPFIFVTPTIVSTIIFTMMLTVVDQVMYMDNSRDPWVIAKVQEFNKKGSENLTDRERIAAIVHATWLQMEKELNGKGGWMSNDATILAFFDNPQNRESGVRYSTLRLLTGESDLFTRLTGGETPEDPLTLEAHSNGNLGFGDKVFGGYSMLSSESNYKHAIKLMKEYEQKLLSGGGNPNATSSDLKIFLNKFIIKDILLKMTDPVKGRGYKVPFSKVDDQIYYAAGGAAELNNVLPILFAAYRHMLGQGTEKHMNNVLETLNTVATANPVIVWAFNGFSLPDARSKMARYLYEVDDYLQKISNAIPASIK